MALCRGKREALTRVTWGSGLRALLGVVFEGSGAKALSSSGAGACLSFHPGLCFPSGFPIVCGFHMQSFFFLADQHGNALAGLEMTILVAGVNPTPSHSKEEVSVFCGVACS